MSKGNSTLCLMVTKGNTVGDRNRRKIYIDSMFGSLCWSPCIGDLKYLHFTARQGPIETNTVQMWKFSVDPWGF